MPDTPPPLALLQSGATPAQIAAQARACRAERIKHHEALTRALSPEQQTTLAALLAAHGAECQLNGMNQALNHARAEAAQHRKAEGQRLAAEAHRIAQANAQARQENTTITALLKKAAEDNAALRDRAHRAEQELIALRASLPGVERVIRAKIIAAAPADHRPLPRLAPRSGVHYRYLSHGFHVRRIARRIEEFIAGPECRGYCRPEKLAEFLLPETPAPTYQHAITHLLLSRRIKQTGSGAYALRAPADPAARPPRPAPQATN